MIRIFKFTLLFLITVVSCSAEGYYTSKERPDHLMLHFTPTVSLLDYKSIESRSIVSPNIGAGIEYAHFFGRHLGLSIGAEFTSFSAFYNFSGKNDSLELFDSWSSRYYSLKQNLTTTEHQSVTYLSIPVKIIYRQIISKKINIYVSLGAAYGTYYKEHKSIISGTVDRQAVFKEINVTVDEFYPLMFGKFKNYINPSSEKQFKNTILGVAQMGLSYGIAPNWNLHTELNFQYGFRNIKTRSINILVPEEYSGVTATNYIGDIRPLSVGLRIGIAYTFDIFNVDCKCHDYLK